MIYYFDNRCILVGLFFIFLVLAIFLKVVKKKSNIYLVSTQQQDALLLSTYFKSKTKSSGICDARLPLKYGNPVSHDSGGLLLPYTCCTAILLYNSINVFASNPAFNKLQIFTSAAATYAKLFFLII